MVIKQYYLGCLSHASYLIADEETKSAAVVDPQRDVDQYVRDAESQGYTIRDVILTHLHADFVAGHLELARRTGAAISLGAAGQVCYPHVARREGDSIDYGNTRLQVLETPGHTPEAISLLAFDRNRDPERPQAVLTGDTLFVGDVGRPDLAVSPGHDVREMAGQLYDSLQGKLLTLPDATTVYPAHGPGSLCGSGHTTGTVSTIGQEREQNPMLRPAGKAAFVEAITHELPALPAYFSRDARLNRVERPLLEDTVAREARPLSLDDTLKLVGEGAQVLDCRNKDEFAQGHLRGALNVGLDGSFAPWAGSLLDPVRPLVVIAPPGREIEAITRLGRVGSEQVAGYLEGGQGAVDTRPELVATQARATVQEVHALLNGPEAPPVIDVRTPDEYRNGHLAGSRNIPLDQLPSRMDEIPRDRPFIIHCQSGYRSSIAASLLAQQGVTCHTDMMGGIAAWQKAGLPLATGG